MEVIGAPLSWQFLTGLSVLVGIAIVGVYVSDAFGAVVAVEVNWPKL